jgi:hypothetical protein
MKLQLRDDNLRLRLSEAEFARLLAGGTVENRSRLPVGGLRQALLGDADAASAELLGKPDNFLLRVPLDLLHAYQRRLPCRDGLTLELPLAEGERLAISIEVDVRDSVRSRVSVRKQTEG